MTIALSVVTPVYNEAQVVDELISRILAVLDRLDALAELIVVDDASSDATPALLERNADQDKRVVPVVLSDNVGQFGATQKGLAAAKGEWIVVLDGDLQDPPEHIAELWKARLQEGCEVVFATKSQRSETWWFTFGQWLYHRLQNAGYGKRPANAGSYLLMSRRIAERVQRLSTPHLNLSIGVALAGPKTWGEASYPKSERHDGESRVGFLGLCQEAVHSLAVTGALHRLAFATVFILAASVALAVSCQMQIVSGLLGFLALFASVLGTIGLRLRRRASAELVTDLPRHPSPGE